ncbi:hypothetical protein PVL29_012021 [Vitis rotundifolia]|uniref:Pentatricopeptide repeat-containing protein n=1 Tax=Vitis rotundifolia TaxID=103349 RepID=A0AA38ZQG9_VITRO|nr:hypothetical protein PVL29_012021 [Vitis rotundifolia]
MVSACAKMGDFARKLFDKMPQKDPIVWNTMISGYAQCGQSRKVSSLFNLMQRQGVILKRRVSEIFIQLRGFMFHNKVRRDNSASFGSNDDENPSIQMIFSENDPPNLDYDALSCSQNGLNEDCDVQTKSSPQTGSDCLLQNSGKLVLSNLRVEDYSDKFPVETSSSFSAWSKVSQTVVHAW